MSHEVFDVWTLTDWPHGVIRKTQASHYESWATGAIFTVDFFVIDAKDWRWTEDEARLAVSERLKDRISESERALMRIRVEE